MIPAKHPAYQELPREAVTIPQLQWRFCSHNLPQAAAPELSLNLADLTLVELQ